MKNEYGREQEVKTQEESEEKETEMAEMMKIEIGHVVMVELLLCCRVRSEDIL